MFVALQKLITPLALLAVIASTSIAETSLCSVNCALVGLTSSQHEHMNHPEQTRDSSMSMVMPMTSHAGQSRDADMDTNAKSADSELVMRSRQCATYSDSFVLASGSKSVLTRTIGVHSNLGITTVDFGNSAYVVNLSIARDFLPPPVGEQTPSAPIRI